MLVTDSLEAAGAREIGFSDRRVQHYWDPDRALGRLLSQTLSLKSTVAWDVYLIYPPDHVWDAEFPPMPKFWMHQLDEEPSQSFNPLELKQSVQAMIERFRHR